MSNDDKRANKQIPQPNKQERLTENAEIHAGHKAPIERHNSTTFSRPITKFEAPDPWPEPKKPTKEK